MRRCQPIILTAAATLAMILSRSVFWGPIMVAIWRADLATALTLLFLPALYAAWFRVKNHKPVP